MVIMVGMFSISDSRCCFLLSFLSFLSPLVYQTCSCLTQRVGLAWLWLPAVICLAVGACCSAPLLLLTCHSHVARSVFPLSCWPRHATARWFFLSWLTHTHAHARDHTCEPAMVRGRVRREHQCASPHARVQTSFRFCPRKERTANSRQLEALKTINYRVARLKGSKRCSIVLVLFVRAGTESLSELLCRSTDCEIKSRRASVSLWQTDALLWCV